MKYPRKTIAAVISGLVALGVGVGFLPQEFNTPEFIGGLTAVVATIAAVLTKEKEEKK